MSGENRGHARFGSHMGVPSASLMTTTPRRVLSGQQGRAQKKNTQNKADVIGSGEDESRLPLLVDRMCDAYHCDENYSRNSCWKTYSMTGRLDNIPQLSSFDYNR